MKRDASERYEPGFAFLNAYPTPSQGSSYAREQRARPLPVRHAVVLDERHDVALGTPDADGARLAPAAARSPDDLHPVLVDLEGSSPLGRDVDCDHFELVDGGLRKKRLHAAAAAWAERADSDDYGEARHCRRTVTA